MLSGARLSPNGARATAPELPVTARMIAAAAAVLAGRQACVFKQHVV